MTGSQDEPAPRASVADYGLVGLVGGMLATALLGIATLVIAPFFAGVPVIALILLGLATTVTVVSLVVWLATRDTTIDSDAAS